MPRCPNGTRRNKKSGNCELVAKKAKSTTQKKVVKRSKKMELSQVVVSVGLLVKSESKKYVIDMVTFKSPSGKNVVFEFTGRDNFIYLQENDSPMFDDDIPFKNGDLNALLKRHNYDMMPKTFDKSLIEIHSIYLDEDENMDEDDLKYRGMVFSGYELSPLKYRNHENNAKNIDLVHRAISKLLTEALNTPTKK